MSQKHHAVSKYDKAKIWSTTSVLYIKGTLLLRETMILTYTLHSLGCIFWEYQFLT
jgi:hypothetical protein